MRLCLNMIVKNEAARIERCLASVAPWVSSWCIVDTGSTDGTQSRIERFFHDLGICGLITEAFFKDFATTRNHALGMATDHKYDYLLLVDADMELVVDDPKWAENLTAPAYRMLQKNGGLAYQNVRLLRADQHNARYVGVTHEYLSTEGETPNLGGAWFIDHADGSNRAGKFERDAALLRADVADKARSFYYLGQSLRDMGDKRGAAEAYGIAAQIDQWPEERWHAELSRARCLRDYGAEDWVGVALSAFGHRPTRAEPLYDLAKHFREQGLNEASLLFSAPGWLMQRPKDDLLFIEDAVYDWGMHEEFAICAFYSKHHRGIGRVVCNSLALDRNVPAHVRETARRNLFFYAQPLAELCPSFRPGFIPISSPTDWAPLNPSVARLGEKVWCILRTVNYRIDDAGRYVMPEGETAIRTRNYLVSVNPDDFSKTILQEIEIDLGKPLYDQVLGLEDMRLFGCSESLSFSATTRQTNTEGIAEQGCGTIGAGDYAVMIARPYREKHHEKNWMPIIDSRHFLPVLLYKCDPTCVVSTGGAMISETIPPFACENFSGGSQLIPFDSGYLCVIHESITSPLDGKRCYQHRFVWFDADLALQHVSPRFWLHANNQIEFVAGMCWHPDEERLIISYGVRDAEAWLGVIDALEVCRLLGREPAAPVREMPPHRLVPRHPPEPEIELLPLPSHVPCPNHVSQPDLPTHCDALSYSWALSQTNRPLRSRDEIDTAIAHLRNLKLPPHPDFPKNWDNLIAVAHATATTGVLGSVLDAGGTRESVFLCSLRERGYGVLYNVNCDEPRPGSDSGIRYLRGDIQDLRRVFGDGSFGFIACLSVIEHGVDVRAFLREVARIIKPGGHLFLSFDYWETPIDCGDRRAFGAPVRIFNADEVQDMQFYAGDQGLAVVGDVDYKCQDCVVNWLGLEFTFMNLLLRREGGSRA